jgi:hypothetical protein
MRDFGSDEMTTVIDIQRRSRREFFGDLAFVVGGATFLAAATAPQPAAAKVAPQDVGYQPTPKGAARCDNCTQWQAPNACKVVSGNISPRGWCSIYVHKS